MRPSAKKGLAAAFASAWVLVMAAGAANLWHYDSTAGTSAQAPQSWPKEAHISPHPAVANLILSLHPKCPCSAATVYELAKIMTACNGKLLTTVLLVRPAGAPADWTDTTLATSAAAIPGVTLITDDLGTESKTFGASTSGQCLLYAADGQLLFSGGITESRGHAGDNAGESAIISLVLDPGHPPAQPANTPVYGCSLFDVPGPLLKVECKACHP